MSIQTKREELEREVNAAVKYSHDADHLMNQVDAYGDARELKGHVEACEHGINKPSDFGDDVCGDGDFLCDRAKALGGKA